MIVMITLIFDPERKVDLIQMIMMIMMIMMMTLMSLIGGGDIIYQVEIRMR